MKSFMGCHIKEPVHKNIVLGVLLIIFLIGGCQIVRHICESNRDYTNKYSLGYQLLQEDKIKSIRLDEGEEQIIYLNESFGIKFERTASNNNDGEKIIGYIDFVTINQFQNSSYSYERLEKLLRIKWNMDYEVMNEYCIIQDLSFDCFPGNDATEIYEAQLLLPEKEKIKFGETTTGVLDIVFRNTTVDLMSELNLRCGVSITEEQSVIFSLEPVEKIKRN